METKEQKTEKLLDGGGTPECKGEIVMPVPKDRNAQLAFFSMLPLNKPGQKEQVAEALGITAKELDELKRTRVLSQDLSALQARSSEQKSVC